MKIKAIKAKDVRIFNKIARNGLVYEVLDVEQMKVAGNGGGLSMTIRVTPSRPNGKNYFYFYEDNEVEIILARV